MSEQAQVPVAWVTLESVAALNNYLAAAMVEAINTAAIADGQTDRFTVVRDNVVLLIRSYINSSKMMLSGTAMSIPPELGWVAAWRIVEMLQASLPGMNFSEDQRRLIEQANKTLDDLKRGDLRVSVPTDPLATATVQGRAGVQVVRAGGSKVADEGFGGISTT